MLTQRNRATVGIEKRGFDCTRLNRGLSAEDCAYMSSIGMAGQGYNAWEPSRNIWIGSNGPNRVTFVNTVNQPITIVVWDMPPGDYQSSFMNVRRAQVTYSLPRNGDSVTISINNGVTGGWAALNNRQTRLSQYGQIDNTWGEFTTGGYATVNISRLVNMRGNPMSVAVHTGCVTDMNRCVFTCKNGNTCGESGSYNLDNCAAGSQPGAAAGIAWGNPSGGCQGWSNGGALQVLLGA